jgi:hypothetical protein
VKCCPIACSDGFAQAKTLRSTCHLNTHHAGLQTSAWAKTLQRHPAPSSLPISVIRKASNLRELSFQSPCPIFLTSARLQSTVSVSFFKRDYCDFKMEFGLEDSSDPIEPPRQARGFAIDAIAGTIRHGVRIFIASTVPCELTVEARMAIRAHVPHSCARVRPPCRLPRKG